jgi:hypothetical protein
MKNMEWFSKHLNLLALLPSLPPAKQETIEFYKEVYRWMGELTFKDFKLHMEVKDEIVKFRNEYVKVPMEIKREVIGNENKLQNIDPKKMTVIQLSKPVEGQEMMHI